MKNKHLIFSLAIAVLLFSGCGKIEKRIEVGKGQRFPIEEELEKYGDIEWKSEAPEIAEVKEILDFEIKGINAGKTKVTGSVKGKIVAEYDVTVIAQKIDSVVLSKNSCEISVGEECRIQYSVFPESADSENLTWKSSDEIIAKVGKDGTIYGVTAGQTKIYLSDGDEILGSCDVTVKLQSAYERLSVAEKAFVDTVLKWINDFKNPYSLVVREIYGVGNDGWWVTITAENSFGGSNNEFYFLTKDYGFSIETMVSKDILSDSGLDVKLVNEAIAERR